MPSYIELSKSAFLPSASSAQRVIFGVDLIGDIITKDNTGQTAPAIDTGSFLVTASANSNVITFTKGDTTTFNVTVDAGSSPSAEIVENVAMSGTGSNTTTTLIYGINVVTSSNSSSFCARLPLATKGKTVTVINNTNYKARILPSQTGGSVNGVENGAFDVPADNQAYYFVCYDNPAPGGWSVAATPLGNVIDYPEWIVDHVQGQETKMHGTYQINPAPNGIGAGIDFDGNLYLIPNARFWDTFAPISTVATKLKVSTNALASEFPSPVGGPNYFDYGINLVAHGAFKNNPNGATSGQRLQYFLNKGDIDFPNPFSVGQNINVVPDGGLVNSPVLVGDANTVYADSIFYGNTKNGVFNNNLEIGAGDPGMYSDYYYIFGIIIGSEMPTKQYRFKFELETQP
jgi:hypothetical protein